MIVMGPEILLVVGVVIILTCGCFILMECEFCECNEHETKPMSEDEEI